MGRRHDTVTFLTDYGRTDEFVGIVHSVLRSIAPHAHVIDLTHDIAPYDVRAGGLLLARSAPWLCPGVVLAVVDPGVGTPRRAIGVEVGDGASVLVGPDNGLLAPAVAMCGGATRAVELTSDEHRLESPGPTFDGRDVFAPAAAHLCNGVDLAELGPLVDPVTLFPGVLPVTREEDGGLVAEVLWVDRFGNAQLNVDPDELVPYGDRVALRFNGELRTGVRAATFAEVKVGEIGLVVDSYGLVSVAVDQRSAATELGLGAGTEVIIEPLGDEEPPGAGIATPVELGRRGDGGSAG
ncbi:MAG: SAM-dependent chlorinase/fluorinase [Acidimicrobiales bacterium]